MPIGPELAPGDYFATVPRTVDEAFTAWRMTNRASVKIREIYRTSSEDPTTVYTLRVVARTPTPDLPLGIELARERPSDVLFPTDDPSYDPEPASPWWKILGAVAVVALGVALLARGTGTRY